METVHIDTTQNVALHYEVATIVDRCVAYLIDLLILLGYFVGVSMLLSSLRPVGAAPFLVMFIFGFPWIFYHLICELTMNGQSIGKRARRIKVARLDGGQPTLGQYLLRWVLRFIDSFCYLGLIVMLFNGKGQRLGDLAAGTTVISLKQRVHLSDTLGMDVPDQHDVTFPEAAHLTDAHARLVKDVLGNKSDVRPTLLVKLAQRLQGELKVTTALAPEPFLRTLLKDYQYLTSR